MKTILIVGATGNIGSYLMSHLRRKGFEVVGISRHPQSKDTLLLDMRTIPNEQISRLLKEKNIDTIIHCVAVLKAKTPEDISLGQWVSNKLLLNEVGRTKKHIIFGSVAEYGLQGVPTLKETSPLTPETDYGLSKLLQTSSALHCFTKYRIKGVVLRLSNVISPVASQKSLIHKILAQIKGSRKNRIAINDLRIERDFIDVRDIAAIVEQFLIKDTFESVYNLSSGVNTTYKELIDTCNTLLIKMNKSKLRIEEGDRTEPFNRATTSNRKILNWLGGYTFHPVHSSLEWCMGESIQKT